LLNSGVSAALIDFAQVLGDDDFAAALLGDVALALVRSKRFQKAEEVASFIRGQERSEHLRSIAEAEAKAGETHRARKLLKQARQAASIYEFATQRAQSIAAVAATMEIVERDAAAEAWEAAVLAAAPAQDAGGTDGPEASGVLLEAVEAFLRLSLEKEAREVAAQIKHLPLRERASALCK
jgi:hypothetical protein